MKRKFAVGTATVALAFAGFAAPVASAHPQISSAEFGPLAGCGAVKNVSLRGAEAHWTVICSSGNKVSINGWVKDTNGSADGQCAQVYATFPYSGVNKSTPLACGNGQRLDFIWSSSGNSVDAWLREV
ncbi:hypothetical protein [Streptomyces sp. NBC_00878]|uniref:hypothetical protein n=1 Tax=Streptomyces sp. NBC_00878 TaxID=2975854 RepID=UPI00224EEEC1|nr:hypothetical protein [Streptomyces sp. NBC_00878]MCX4906571.1 hypothetical protein [Streptomyces sp. NBC_00878]